MTVMVVTDTLLGLTYSFSVCCRYLFNIVTYHILRVGRDSNIPEILMHRVDHVRRLNYCRHWEHELCLKLNYRILAIKEHVIRRMLTFFIITPYIHSGCVTLPNSKLKL